MQTRSGRLFATWSHGCEGYSVPVDLNALADQAINGVGSDEFECSDQFTLFELYPTDANGATSEPIVALPSTLPDAAFITRLAIPEEITGKARRRLKKKQKQKMDNHVMAAKKIARTMEHTARTRTRHLATAEAVKTSSKLVESPFVTRAGYLGKRVEVGKICKDLEELGRLKIEVIKWEAR